MQKTRVVNVCRTMQLGGEFADECDSLLYNPARPLRKIAKLVCEATEASGHIDYDARHAELVLPALLGLSAVNRLG